MLPDSLKLLPVWDQVSTSSKHPFFSAQSRMACAVSPAKSESLPTFSRLNHASNSLKTSGSVISFSNAELHFYELGSPDGNRTRNLHLERVTS